ncbi:hypothetical protein BOTNAR_0286g00090 [Botryotinia narcissicola]|uniref:Heterokaryon incompatibility domain-containing protein n=1 Tax=Botryotinia narcissicola TaxID=278944 RepID=A0A4Z1IAE0_9HELO|nr:hypothetical protein BOTNAR_0286g00090 [Botryotinia narcissicola]
MITRWASFSVRSLRAFLENKPQDEMFMPRSVTALKNMLQRPYWRRVWIQQEVALPPTVTMQFGHELLPFNVVSDFGRKMIYFLRYDEQECWRSSNSDLTPTVVETVPLTRLDFYRMSESLDHEKDEVPNLLHHLYSSITLESTDPSDRIFALLGLPHFEKYRSVVRPSYTKSTSQMFSEAARIIIEEEKSLNLLLNGLTYLEALFRIWVALDIDTSPDSCRRENELRFISEVRLFLRMIEERYRKSVCRRMFGYDLQEIIRIGDESATHENLQFNEKLIPNFTGRVFFRTKNGTLGIGPPEMIPGDPIYRLIGYNDDFILRKAGDHYRLIGDTRIVRVELPSFTDGGYEVIEIH